MRWQAGAAPEHPHKIGRLSYPPCSLPSSWWWRRPAARHS